MRARRPRYSSAIVSAILGALFSGLWSFAFKPTNWLAMLPGDLGEQAGAPRRRGSGFFFQLILVPIMTMTGPDRRRSPPLLLLFGGLQQSPSVSRTFRVVGYSVTSSPTSCRSGRGGDDLGDRALVLGSPLHHQGGRRGVFAPLVLCCVCACSPYGGRAIAGAIRAPAGSGGRRLRPPARSVWGGGAPVLALAPFPGYRRHLSVSRPRSACAAPGRRGRALSRRGRHRLAVNPLAASARPLPLAASAPPPPPGGPLLPGYAPVAVAVRGIGANWLYLVARHHGAVDSRLRYREPPPPPRCGASPVSSFRPPSPASSSSRSGRWS